MANDTWTAPSGPSAGVASLSEMAEQRTDNVNVLGLVADGDTSAVKAHRHKVGTLANRPTPGESGRIYLPTDIGLTLYDDGTEWLIGPPLPQKCASLFDEFIAPYDLAWKTVVDGSGNVAQVWAHGGTVQLDTGSTAASNARLMNNTTGGGSLDPAKIHVQLIRLKSDHPTNTVQHLIAGVMGNVPVGATDPTDGIYLRKVSNGNWFGVCRASSTETTQDLGGQFSAETVVIIERTSSGVNFYKDTWNAAGLQGSEITTNIPTAILLLGFRVNNTSTTSSRAMTLNAYGLWSAR